MATPVPSSHTASVAFSEEFSSIHARFLELLAEAAHDLRSPLATVSQTISAVVDRLHHSMNSAADEVSLLRAANERVSRVTTWLDCILADHRLSRAGRPHSVRLRFYPHQLQSALAPLLEPIAQQYGVQLRWEGWSRDLPLLYLDANHVLRAILNLGVNAIRASRPMQTVRIGVQVDVSSAGRLKILVEDEGPGLPEALQRYVADEHAALPLDFPGVGLRIAKQLLDELGGGMRASAPEHSPAVGTRIEVQLPTDDLESLLTDWIDRMASEPGLADAHSRQELRIYAIRAMDGSSSDACDRQLQRVCGSRAFAYRVARSRWLWFTASDSAASTDRLPSLDTDDRLAEAIRNHRIRLQCVFRTESFRPAAWRASTIPSLPQRLARRLAQNARLLIGNWLAPVDSLAPQAMLQAEPVSMQRTLQQAERSDSAGQGSPRRKLVLKPKLLADRFRPPKAPPANFAALRRARIMRRDAAMARALRRLAHEWGTQSERLY